MNSTAALTLQRAATRPSTVRELHYHASGPVLGHFPGHHRSTRGASGFEFRGHAALFDAPDPRRLDLHASLRDPFGNWVVRIYSQRKSIPVVMVADVSASMGFAGTRRKLDVLADFVDSLALSAWRAGDSFGFIGCDTSIREDLLLPQTRMRGAGAELARTLRTLHLGGESARALSMASRYLSRQRALVFLVSDFHLPESDIEVVLASMARHHLVPVVLWDPIEFAPTEASGLLNAADPETGHQTLVWWRPALRKKWLAAQQQRRDRLTAVFRAHLLRPLFIEHGFDPDAVTRYFHA